MSHPIYTLLRDLEHARIPFTLGRYRDDSVLVSLTIVGERIEVDVFEDGHVEVSRFKGDEGIVGDIALVKEIIATNADPPSAG